MIPTINISVRASKVPRFEGIKKRMAAGMTGAGGQAVAFVMRQGEGSVENQFRRTVYLNKRGGRQPWKKTQPFGRQPAPPRTLHRTGKLEAAWTGRGRGSITVLQRRSVKIGVDTRLFPQASRFQSIGATLTRPDPSRALIRGRSPMAWFLGMQLGVWISERRLQMGLRVQPRRVGVNPVMLRRAGAVFRDYVIQGDVRAARAA